MNNCYTYENLWPPNLTLNFQVFGIKWQNMGSRELVHQERENKIKVT